MKRPNQELEAWLQYATKFIKEQRQAQKKRDKTNNHAITQYLDPERTSLGLIPAQVLAPVKPKTKKKKKKKKANNQEQQRESKTPDIRQYFAPKTASSNDTSNPASFDPP